MVTMTDTQKSSQRPNHSPPRAPDEIKAGQLYHLNKHASSDAVSTIQLQADPVTVLK